MKRNFEFAGLPHPRSFLKLLLLGCEPFCSRAFYAMDYNAVRSRYCAVT